MRQRSCNPLGELLAFLLATTAWISVQGRAGAAEESQKLQLEVVINDVPSKLVGTFTHLPDGRFAATRAELTEIGLKAPGSGEAEDLVVIEDITGVTYRYDDGEQKINFSAPDEQRVTKSYDARPSTQATAPTRNEYGAVMNYTLFGAANKELSGASGGPVSFSGGNASLDLRAFSPYGTLSQTAIVGTTLSKNFDTLRLDTTFSYSDPDRVLTYRVGDTISGGLAWTRPIRLGGVQIQRNFGLRPDLVTLPLPSVSGSAAVPSTVDVYVNGLKTFSQDVGSGPYQISNLPVMSGGGTARIVLNDATGRSVESSLPFYMSPKLLREGLWDFSAEAGVPRIGYGVESFSYVLDAVASASARRGVFEWLTLEAHGEGGAGLINGGLGAVLSAGSWGAVTVAGSASHFDGALGYQGYAALDTQLLGLNFHASSQRTFGKYNDLAAVTARALPALTSQTGRPNDVSITDSITGLLPATSYLPAKFLDTVSVSAALPYKLGNVGAGFLHLETADGKRSDIVNMSYSRPLFWDASLYLSAFVDLKDKKTAGVFAGMSIPFGEAKSASVGASQTSNGTTLTADASKTIQPEVGSYGWRIHDGEGATTYRFASGQYRASVAQVEGSVWQDSQAVGGSVQAQGAISTMGGGVFLSNRIDDSFAVVDAGAPDVDVMYENRAAGKTNGRGQVLIPSLRSYQPNNIAIDPKGLPLNADISSTQAVVTPADRTGVLVRFNVKTEVQSAIVVLTDRSGKFLPAGMAGRLDGTEETFIVGYDGRAYIKELGETNDVVVTTAAGECRASFPYKPQKDEQVVIGPVVCQ